MNPNLPDYIAVDIAKSSLRLQSQSIGMDIENNKPGFKELLAHIETFPDPLIVMEATGGYEQPLMRFLIKNEIAMVLVNPARVRSFAASEEQKAKTDRIDAEVLLRFARNKKLRSMPNPALHQIAWAKGKRTALSPSGNGPFAGSTVTPRTCVLDWSGKSRTAPSF